MRDLENEIYRLEAVVRGQIEALNHWRKVYDETQLESRVRDWVVSRIGSDHMDRKERAMRLLEEAIELAQSEGISESDVNAQTCYVYQRPSGDPFQEAGGVAVCLYGWCAGAHAQLTHLALKEVERIEAKPLEQIRGSIARKKDADLVTVVERKHQPFEYD